MNVPGDEPHDYDNLVEALAGARGEGYTHDFNVDGDQVSCSELDRCFRAPDLTVDRIIHLEGMDSSPDSRSTVYWITAEGGTRGTLVEPDGTYVEGPEAELLKQLRIARPTPQA